MRILYLNQYAGSISMGMEYRPYYFAKEWQKLGHEVTIVASTYSHLRSSNPTNVSHSYTQTEIDGVPFLWFKGSSYDGNGAARALGLFAYASWVWRNAKKIAHDFQPDIVLVSSTHHLDIYGARRIAQYANAALIYEVHDMWPATLIELGGMSATHPFVKLIDRAEKYFCKHSDAVVSLLGCNQDYFEKRGLSAENWFHVNNGIVQSDWDEPEKLPAEHQALLSELKSKGKFIVLYFGGHALSNNLNRLIDLAELNLPEEIEFVLVGDGIEKKELQQRVTNDEIENVHFLPPVNKLAIPTLATFSDVIYMTALNSPLYRFGLALNKMFDSMAAGKPILMDIPVTCLTPIEEAECGFVVKSFNLEHTKKYLLQLMSMSPAERDTMGQRGQSLVIQKYTYSALAQEMIAIFEQYRR